MKYKEAGVDIKIAEEAKERIRKILNQFKPKLSTNIGRFAGIFPLPREINKNYVLLASCDGVGTKTKLASLAGKYEIIGYDIVAHCVNDLMVQGGEPVFFLDYIAMGKLSVEVIQKLFSGMARCAAECGVAIIGGETAEMPGIYQENDFDLVGFILGFQKKNNLLPKTLKPGNKIIGVYSSGLHTNGYSLVRKIIEENNLDLNYYYEGLKENLASALIKEHLCYYKILKRGNEKNLILAAAHITGGGIAGNLKRILNNKIDAHIKKGSWEINPLFNFIQKVGKVEEEEMYEVFNMGIGLILIIEESKVNEVIKMIKRNGFNCNLIGEIEGGNGNVFIE